MKSLFYRKRGYWLVVVCIWFSVHSMAQSYGYELIDSYEGKQIFELSDLIELSDGKLLVGGPAGPLIFDGYGFRRPMMRKDRNYPWLWSLTKDAKGRTWGLGRSGGIYQLETDIVRVHPATPELVQLLKARKHVGLKAGLDDTLYVTFAFRNYYLRIAPDGSVDRMEAPFKDLQNVIYCKDVGPSLVTAIDNWKSIGDTVHLVLNDQVFSIPGQGKPDKVNALKYDGKHLIICHKTAYLVGADNEVKTVSLSSRVNGLMRDSKGAIWLAMEDHLECWSADLGEKLFSALENVACATAYEDYEGIVWVATRNGLYKQQSTSLLRYWREDFDYFQTNLYASFVKSGSSLFLYNGNGIAAIESMALIPTDMELFPDATSATELDNELLTFGIDIYQKSSLGFHQISPPSPFFKPLLNEDSTYWIMAPGNILKMDLNQKVLFSAKDSFDSLPPIQFRTTFSKPGFVDDEGKLWFHTDRKVYMMDDKGIEQLKAPEPSEQALDNVTAVRRIGSVVWMAARNGFWSMYAGQLKFYPMSDSVLHYNAFIEKESDSALWMLGVNGGMRIVFQTNGTEVDLNINVLDHTSGIRTRAIWGASFWNGHMWFSSKEGVSRLNVQEWLEVKTRRPATLIYQVNQSKSLAKSDNHHFEHDENNVSIAFKTYSKIGVTRPKYHFRLLGADSSWSTTIDTHAVFSGLQPGDYQFEIKATNGLGSQSTKTTIYSFTVEAPFWKTWWFLLLSFVCIQSLVGGVLWRMSTMKRKVVASEKEALEAELKTLRMQINPHFMYNALHAIGESLYGTSAEPGTHQMAQFAHLSREILEASRQKSISLFDELEIAKSYLQFISKYTENHVSYEVQVADRAAELLEMVEIPPLLLQPLLENALQHGAAKVAKGIIRLEVDYEGSEIRITIEDNGPGIDAHKERPDGTQAAGIPILVERVKKLNRAIGESLKISWEAIEADGSGTRVRISIPHKD